MAESLIEPVSRAEAKANGLLRYFTGLSCRRGHTGYRSAATGHCLQCSRERHHERQANPEYREQRSEAAKKRRDQPGFIEAETERYRSLEVQKRVKDYRRTETYQKKRQEYAKSTEGRQALSQRDRRFRATPYGAAKELARQMVRRCLEMTNSEKRARTCDILGYAPGDLVKHIESLFMPGMSWGNRRKWQVDHIRPLSSFDLTDPDQLKAANSLHNLRPMWATLNRKKSNKWDGRLTLLM